MNSIAYIQKYGIHFSELQLAAVITSVLHGLAYLHTMGIVQSAIVAYATYCMNLSLITRFIKILNVPTFS